MGRDPKKIGLAYSIMLTLPGTPIIYYGDEFGSLNDETNYKEMIKLTGKDDTRFLVRGKIDWKKTENELKNPESLSAKVYSQVRNMIKTRNQYRCFGRGGIEWLELTGLNNKPLDEILVYKRSDGKDEILIIQNLSESPVTAKLPGELKNKSWMNVLDNKMVIDKNDDSITLPPLSYFWLSEKKS
jgi:glycosidase